MLQKNKTTFILLQHLFYFILLHVKSCDNCPHCGAKQLRVMYEKRCIIILSYHRFCPFYL